MDPEDHGRYRTVVGDALGAADSLGVAPWGVGLVVCYDRECGRRPRGPGDGCPVFELCRFMDQFHYRDGVGPVWTRGLGFV